MIEISFLTGMILVFIGWILFRGAVYLKTRCFDRKHEAKQIFFLVNLLDYASKSDLLLNIIGNFAMFIPTGIMTPLIYPQLKSFKKTLLTGAGISLAIEIIQLPFAVRASDVDDLILNTLGCIAGYGIYALVRLLAKRKAGK